MRVLLLTQVLPYPPDSGPKIKTYHVLKYLAQQYNVTLVSFVRDSDKPEYVHHLETFCERVITVPMVRSRFRDLYHLGRSLLRGETWMMLRDESPAMRRVLADLAAGPAFDIVHADQLNMAQYALPFENAYKVLDLHNALWMLYKRLAETLPLINPMKAILIRDWPLLKRYEGAMCQRFDAVTTVTEEDCQLLREAGASNPITVIPIAIDTSEQALVSRQPSGPHIFHIGTMYWPPNIDGINWFLDDIYPLIKAQLPEVRCTLVGSRPPHSIERRGHADHSVSVTGYIEDPMPIFQDASMMIVPLRSGGGMRVKILNALAQGIPMVSTTMGCEGILVEHNRDILLADNADDFASACVRLLTDSDLNNRISQAGRATAEQHYDYRQACQALGAIYATRKPDNISS